MEKTRSLPPLIRGRVTGVLDLFIDDIKLTNSLLLAYKNDIVVQLQWWGEDLPIFLRPQRTYRQESKLSKHHETHCQYVRYEIKTTLELFKLYLKTCEVLELSILISEKNCIIGSAFLKDLIQLLNKNNNHLTLPIFDYLGEEIGTMRLCFNFSEIKTQETICNSKSNYSSVSESQGVRIFNKAKKSFHIPTEDFLYDRGKNINFRDIETINTCAFTKNDKTECANYHKAGVTNHAFKNVQEDVFNDRNILDTESGCKCFPEIQIASDSSKILYFGISAQKNKTNNPKMGITSKFNSNSIKFKRKPPNSKKFCVIPSDLSSNNKKLQEKNLTTQKLFGNIQKESEVKQEKLPSMSELVQSKKLSNYNQTLIQDPSSKESLQSKVLDYLLGSDLSKKDEESAVNELKKMSPSHDLVTSINQLCLTSDSDSMVSVKIYEKNSLKPSSLSFNLNDPIERNYYEKFFLQSKPSRDLELAELLNQPENSAILGKLKSGDADCCNKNSQSSGSGSDSKFSVYETKKDKKLKSNENFSKYYNCYSIDDKAKNCARCKYFKKLDELDSIIESLKHFEERMRSHDNDMQSALAEKSNWFSKKSQLEDS